MTYWAKTLINKFDQEIKRLLRQLEKTNKEKAKPNVCQLCGVLKRNLEPVVMYCNGFCEQQKIRKGATYYVDTQTKENHYCQSCYNKMGPTSYITLENGNKIRKAALQKLVNDVKSDEPWAQCDRCDGWVHQICALFNGRENADNHDFICPLCVREEKMKEEEENKEKERRSRRRMTDGEDDENKEEGKPKKKIATTLQSKELPECDTSRRMEAGMQRHLDKAYEIQARKLGIPVEDVLKVTDISVRVVLCVEGKQRVRKQFYSFYKNKGFPKHFPSRTKCILLFHLSRFQYIDKSF